MKMRYKGILAAIAAGVGLMGGGVARADIVGFGTNGAGYTLNKGGSNSGPTVSGDVLTITDNNGGEANSIYNNTPQSYVNGFNASFTYTTNGGADGAVFVLQNNSLTAVGNSGGALGYSPTVSPSLGVEFNLFSGNGGSATGIDTNGNIGYSATQNGVDVTNGNPVNVTVSYNASTHLITETLSQVNAGVTDTDSRTLTQDLGALLGGSGAYVGFTGGTGGVNSTQTISNFSYVATAAATPLPASVYGGLLLLAGLGLTRFRRGASVN